MRSLLLVLHHTLYIRNYSLENIVQSFICVRLFLKTSGFSYECPHFHRSAFSLLVHSRRFMDERLDFQSFNPETSDFEQ